jgi:prepilin-type N-terminal cleavage/methylation domain-containing protein
MDLSRRRTRRIRGFALIETIIAIVILAVGLLGVAALLAKVSGTSVDSRYMGTQVMLASEKLEDLNRAPKATLVPGGGLAANTGAYGTYWDQVQISSNGSNDLPQPDKATIVNDTLNGAAPAAPSADMIVFTRRWLIEQDVALPAVPGAAAGTTGTLRVTVIVIPQTGTQQEQAQTFQVSLVRPI